MSVESAQRFWWRARLLPMVGATDEALAAALITADSLGWQREDDTVLAYFADGEDPSLEFEAIFTKAGVPLSSWECQRVPEEPWVERQMETLQILPITERIVIVPTRLGYDPKADEIPILLDAGMAFGTGEHATTRSCLRLIERHLKRGEQEKLLDVGTGSGILAFAASKLGAGAVTGTEIDPDACRVCEENARLNHVEGTWACVDLSQTNEFAGPFDFVVANIVSWTLAVQLPFILRRLAPNGRLLISGVLSVEKEKMQELWRAHRLTPADEIIDGEWLTQLLVRASA